MEILINGKENPNIKAIQVDDYWVVADSNGNENGKYLMVDKNSVLYLQIDDHRSHLERNDQWSKIIASIGKRIDKPIPVIEFVEQSVEKLARLKVIEKYPYLAFDQWGYFEDMFKEGYNQAKSSDKRYTEEQVLKAIDMAKEALLVKFTDNDYESKFSDNEIIQSLNQPKLPDVINLDTVEDVIHNALELNKTIGNFGKPYEPDLKYKLKTTSTPEGEVIQILI